MKCTNKFFIISALIAAVLASGCGEISDAGFKNAYDPYETSEQYKIISSEDTSSLQNVSFFASDLCVSNGEDLGTDQTDSQVAEAAGVFNLDTNKVTYAQNIYGKMYPASTTKVLTAYIALKYGDLDSIVTVSEYAADQAIDSSVCGLVAGDHLTLHQLLYGLMLRSGNDAAIAIAEAISGSVENFAVLMNQEAAALGATNSHFVNPNGLQDEEHYMTIYDMYLIFQAAIQNDQFKELIRTSSYTCEYLDPTGQSIQQIWNSTNKYLLGTEDFPAGVTVIGGKTGTTGAAGYCLVLYSQNTAGQDIISVIMKADCRRNLYYYMDQILRGYAN